MSTEITLVPINNEIDLQKLIDVYPQTEKFNKERYTIVNNEVKNLLTKYPDFANVKTWNKEVEKEIVDVVLQIKSELKVTYDNRIGVTRVINDLIENDFTKPEKVMKVLIDFFDKKRNEYAQHVTELRKQEEARIKLLQEKETEIINIKSDYQTALNGFYYNYLHLVQSKIKSDYLDTLTLENYETKKADFDAKEINYKIELYFNQKFKDSAENTAFKSKRYKYHDSIAVQTIISEISHLDIFNSKKSEFDEDIRLFVLDLNSKIVAKKGDLERDKLIKDENEKKRIQALRDAEIKAENERIAKELEKQKAEQQKKIDAIKNEEVVVSNIVVEASAVSETQTEMKIQTVFEIDFEVLTNSGLLSIFNHWYQNVGKDLTTEELKKKLDFAYKFVEKSKNDKKELSLQNIVFKEIAVAGKIKK